MVDNEVLVVLVSTASVLGVAKFVFRRTCRRRVDVNDPTRIVDPNDAETPQGND